jgi:cytochrome c oxidase subunit 2
MNSSRRNVCLSVAAGFGTLLFGGMLNAQGATKPKAKAKERVIKIQAKRFVYTPNEITIKKGEAVVLEFTSLDFVHGFNIPDLNVRADLPPGQITRVSIKPEKSGVYDFLCDNFCGSGHEEMSGRIIVKG